MSILDGILKNITGAPDDVVNLAKQVGLDPAMVQQAIAALGTTHVLEGDTVGLAAEKTGLSTTSLDQIVAARGAPGCALALQVRDRDVMLGLPRRGDAQIEGGA